MPDPEPDERIKSMHKKAYLLLLATTLFWAGNAVAGKLAIGHVSPMLLNAARWGFMLAIMLLIGRRQLSRDMAAMTRDPWPLLFLGALGYTVFSVAMYSAVVYTSATNVSIEQGGIPLFVFLASYFLFGERTTLGQVVGFALSFVGVVVTATNGRLYDLIHFQVNFGDVLMLLAVAVFGIFTAALRRQSGMHWISLVTMLCIGATVSAIPFVIAEAIAGATILPDRTGWLIIAYAVIFPSVAAQAFYVKSIALIGANRTGVFVNFLPVWGALLSVLIIGEKFQAFHAVALVLVVAGVLVAEYSGHQKASRASAA